jgi:hypothetical protein
MANIACRQLGYRSAFMANKASNMAFGESVDSGVVDPGIYVLHCQGDEQSLRDCQLQVDSASCTVHEAVAAACSTAASDSAASTYPVAIETEVQAYMMEMAIWHAAERARLQQEKSETKQECVTKGEESLLQGIPTPFHDVQAIQEAYLFHDFVTTAFEQISMAFNSPLKQDVSTIQLIQEALPKIRLSVLGIDFSGFFPSPMTLDQVKSVMQQSRSIEALKNWYLSSNKHNAIHWFLDSPYRYYSQPEEGLLSDRSSWNMFNELQRNGIVVINDFGADTESIVKQAEEALTGDPLYRKNETSIAGGGSIITSRRPIPHLIDLLAHNRTLVSVINAYLGPSILHGYKVTRLTKDLKSTDQYNAGMYHHDRAGRRIKLFIFLNDVDCDMGHPTKVAKGSQNILFYKSEDYPVTRFSDDYVEKNYEIIKGCGKRGGGFLFDTHTLHKGTVQGDRERTVVIAEYHHVAKCAYSKEYSLGIPCPGGDIYRTDTPLAVV